MSFHASRFDARVSQTGEIILYADQDTALWNMELVEQGKRFLHRASTEEQFSKFHVEAAIAYWHTIKEDSTEKWENILQLYNRLLQSEYSPVAALNRTYALSKARGKAAAIHEAEKLNLGENHLYQTMMGELYSEGDKARAMYHFEKALNLATAPADKALILKKISILE